MFFYSGKDAGGIGSRILSVCILSALFFLIIAKKNKFVSLIIGFSIGVVSCIISFFLYRDPFYEQGLSFHVLACILVMAFLLIDHFFSPSARIR